MTASNAISGPQGLSQVLAMFRGHRSLTRADVMVRTGLARSTVNQRLDALVSAGLLKPEGAGTPTRGRPAERFVFNAEGGLLLVADVGATGLRAALCDLAGSVLFESESPADVADGPDKVLGIVDGHFSALLGQADRSAAEVWGVGLDVPGPVDFGTGQVVSPPIMRGWDRFDIPGWFAPRYDCPVLVDKDVNAMAFGEQRSCYPEVEHVLMLKIGTGIGCGMIAGGQVHRGADGAAGDLGHIHITVGDVDVEPVCQCGNTGCVEAYAGGWALVRDLRAAGKDVTTVTDAVGLIRAGDLTAVRLARRAGRILGEAVADTVNLFNPRVIAIGGQLAHTEEQLFAGIRELVYRRSLPLATRNLQIVRSKLDPRAGVIGLALLLADLIFAPERLEQSLRA